MTRAGKEERKESRDRLIERGTVNCELDGRVRGGGWVFPSKQRVRLKAVTVLWGRLGTKWNVKKGGREGGRDINQELERGVVESKASARTANTNTEVARIGSSDNSCLDRRGAAAQGSLPQPGVAVRRLSLSRNGSHQRRPKQLQGLGWGTLTRGGATGRPAEESTGLAAMGGAPLCMTETNEPFFPDRENRVLQGCGSRCGPGPSQVEELSRNSIDAVRERAADLGNVRVRKREPRKWPVCQEWGVEVRLKQRVRSRCSLLPEGMERMRLFAGTTGQMLQVADRQVAEDDNFVRAGDTE